jgi:hypothetical protein
MLDYPVTAYTGTPRTLCNHGRYNICRQSVIATMFYCIKERNVVTEALASSLMTSVVSTALLKEVRAFASVGDGGRERQN